MTNVGTKRADNWATNRVDLRQFKGRQGIMRPCKGKVRTPASGVISPKEKLAFTGFIGKHIQSEDRSAVIAQQGCGFRFQASESIEIRFSNSITTGREHKC